MKAIFTKNRVGLIALFIAVITAVSAFSFACNPSSGAKPKDAVLSEVYDKLTASGKLPNMTKIPERDLEETYVIDKEQLKQWVFAQSENYATEAGEVALFEAKDEAYAKTLEEKLQKHLDQVKKVAANYTPSEAEKLDPVKVIRTGNYVYFVVGEDYNALMQIMKDSIG